MENLVTPNAGFWSGRSVFLTGHTGFKGSWLALWLNALGARVHGYALAPPTTPSMFDEAGVEHCLATHTIGDVRDADALARAMAQAEPEIVIHMAAQPLVRLSYAEPASTYATNVMGTVNLHEAVRRLSSGAARPVTALVNVTTDKCYRNNEWLWGYREDEPLGGHDPYSSSKACSELVTAAYRASFHDAGGPFVGSARAGNVIGGGDWALDRLIPDVLRALDAGTPLVVRSPGATRPWQHVLEPLSGYLLLAERLGTDGAAVAESWNFGPQDDDARPVGWILDRLGTLVPDLRWQVDGTPQVHEANFLKLDSAKACTRLGWRPRWRLETALARTVEWHSAWRAGEDMAAVSRRQIADYAGTSLNG